MPQSRTTIRDVAVLAGVSHQTVSRVINGSDRVSPETQARVEAAIKELDYRPNAIARFMAKGRTRTLACISPNLTDYTLASLIEGAESEARRQGYFLLSASAPDERAFSYTVEQLVSSRRTEGMLVINPFVDGRRSLIPPNVPTVLLGARPRQNEVSSVALEEEQAGKIATRHLLELGHRRIAHITGPMREDCSVDRFAGYQAGLEDAGLKIDPELIFEGDWSATSGYQSIQNLLDNQIPFTAIFAQNDRMAVGAIRALHEAGQRVPQDVSVIGFDDMPLASYFDPPLTTMRQDTFDMGREAARLLLDVIEQPDARQQHLSLPAELVVRRSTAPVP